MNCKKCNKASSVILRNKDHYCCECFLANTNHKFRACIGKNKILSSNEKILLCLSGGLGSTVLLDLVHCGISLDNHKKLRILPYIFHLIGVTENDNILANSVIKLCEKYNLNVHIVHISEYFQTNSQLPEVNIIPQVDIEADEHFQAMLKAMPPSASNDFLCKIKRCLFVRYASLLQCNYIFTAETTTTLAINLLTNLALGRGSQVQNDIGFLDNRDEKIKILRPMKDISKKELNYYINIKQLDYVDQSDIQSISLQSVISCFVTDLQDHFQSTISTVCKTADKIGVADDDICEQCIICENIINTKTCKLSALEATIFSRKVSYGKSYFEECKESTNSSALLEYRHQDATNMFPFINKYLCYACSRNYSEGSGCILPERVQKLLEK